MPPLWQTYLRPKTVEEALQALVDAGDDAVLIAGGTDLMLDLQQGRHPPVRKLVDITEIPELRVLEVRGDELFVGAGVPLNGVAASSLVREHATALAEATSQMAGHQIRNVATLGGNVAHALPAADGAIALLALGATAEVASPDGRRRMPLADLYLGPGRSALKHTEMLTGFYLPLARQNSASAFRRTMRPQGVALPILNAAVWLAREDDRIAEIRIAVGPFGPVPRRALAAESALCGRAPTADALEIAHDALLREARFRTSRFRATQAYRRHLSGILLREAVRRAWERVVA